MTTNEQTMESKPENEVQPALKKEPLGKQILKQVIGIVLAVGLLYFSFRKVNLAELWHYAQESDLKFLAAVCLSALISHILRAWRWIILLKPVSGKSVSMFNSFAAVMYGYAVNVVLPRGGEVARLVSISKTESIPWAGVLPTMFIDRLLDIAMLVMLIGLTITQLPASLNLGWLGPAGTSMCTAAVLGLFALPFVGKIGRKLIALEPIKKVVPASIESKLDELLSQFDQGTRSLTNIGNLLAIAFFSFAIWACYWTNMYLMVYAFHLEKMVSLSNSLLVFAVSSVSVLVPTPGNVGGYHLLTSQALEKIAGVGEAPALAYAAVSHLICFIVISCVPAALCFIVQSGKGKR